MRPFTGFESHVTFANLVSLIQALVWPLVLITLIILYRREIPNLIAAIGGRMSKVTAVGVTLEFAAQPVPETVGLRLEDIREPTSSGPPPASGMQSLFDLARLAAPVDYVRIDLREGRSWLTSRLYLFAVVLPAVLGVRCFVFVCSHGEIPRYFLGLSSPEDVKRDLEVRYPWLRTAMIEAQVNPIYNVQYRYVNSGILNNIRTVLTEAKAAAAQDQRRVEIAQGEALDRIIRSLVVPMDLSQTGGVESFVPSFLQTPSLKRTHEVAPPGASTDEDWVQLGDMDEHARWIRNERQLLDLLGDDLKRQYIVLDAIDSVGHKNQDLTKAVLSKHGDFVAVMTPKADSDACSTAVQCWRGSLPLLARPVVERSFRILLSFAVCFVAVRRRRGQGSHRSRLGRPWSSTLLSA